jgi:hypothetical protein
MEITEICITTGRVGQCVSACGLYRRNCRASLDWTAEVGCPHMSILKIESRGAESSAGQQLPIKLDFYYFSRFLRRRLPLPLENGLLGSLREHGMPASDFDGLHAAIRRHYRRDLDIALNLHPAGDRGIGWRDFGHDSARTLRGYLRPGVDRDDNHQASDQQGQVNCTPSQGLGHHSKSTVI